MPIIDMTIPASLTPTQVKVLVCCICSNVGTLIGAPQPAAGEPVQSYTVGWRNLLGGEVVCDRCKIMPGVVHALLAEAKAVTQ